MDDIDTETGERSAEGQAAPDDQIANNYVLTSAGAETQTSLSLDEKVDFAIHDWFVQHIHGSAVSRAGEALNHLTNSLDALKAKIVQAIKE
jgi:hypothetical protein